MARRRQNTAAVSRRLEGEARERDEIQDVTTMTFNDLWSAVYRLQGRNRGGCYSARIRELDAERARRAKETS
jgi:hypothetical protein